MQMNLLCDNYGLELKSWDIYYCLGHCAHCQDDMNYGQLHRRKTEQPISMHTNLLLSFGESDNMQVTIELMCI